jgi:hypothetical protein
VSPQAWCIVALAASAVNQLCLAWTITRMRRRFEQVTDDLTEVRAALEDES